MQPVEYIFCCFDGIRLGNDQQPYIFVLCPVNVGCPEHSTINFSPYTKIENLLQRTSLNSSVVQLSLRLVVFFFLATIQSMHGNFYLLFNLSLIAFNQLFFIRCYSSLCNSRFECYRQSKSTWHINPIVNKSMLNLVE